MNKIKQKTKHVPVGAVICISSTGHMSVFKVGSVGKLGTTGGVEKGILAEVED